MSLMQNSEECFRIFQTGIRFSFITVCGARRKSGLFSLGNCDALADEFVSSTSSDSQARWGQKRVRSVFSFSEALQCFHVLMKALLFCHSLMWTETMFFFIRGWVMPLCTCIKSSVKLNFYSFSHSRGFVSLSRWSNCISPCMCVRQRRRGYAFSCYSARLPHH